MRSRKFSVGLTAVALVALSVFGTTTGAAAQQEKVLHSFVNSGNDGFYPSGNLILDSSGNIYGTTSGYGRAPFPFGTVYELVAEPGTGTYEEKGEDHGDAELSGNIEGLMAGHCPPCRFDRRGAGLW